MSKYIIKNCPALYQIQGITNECMNECLGTDYQCENITDCVLKQIVEKCTKAIEIYANNNFYDDDRDRFMGESFMAEKILDLFDIQEEVE